MKKAAKIDPRDAQVNFSVSKDTSVEFFAVSTFCYVLGVEGVDSKFQSCRLHTLVKFINFINLILFFNNVNASYKHYTSVLIFIMASDLILYQKIFWCLVITQCN